MNNSIGKPIDRKDGRAKVTGAATYAAEWVLPGLAYGVAVQSTIASGRIRYVDTSAAEQLAGVLGVMTYKNAPHLHVPSNNAFVGKLAERDLLPLQSERIFYDGQHIAVAIAETPEIARQAAALITVTYEEAKPVLDMHQPEAKIYKPAQGLGGGPVQYSRGDAGKGMEAAEIRMEATYYTPVHHHNPMEPHATIALWEGDHLTVYEATQAISGTRVLLTAMLGLQPDELRILSPYVGGGFGSKGFMWAQSVLAPMAAKLVGRPVRIELERTGQMFTCAGRRSFTLQKIALGADKSGKLTAVRHETTAETSFVDEFVEASGIATKMLYAVPNLEVVQHLVRLNRTTPCPTRAPGEATGTFALEVALDELAEKLNIDPVQLLLINYAERDPENGHPFSAKNLRECYEKGAQAIGWTARSNTPGILREGKYLVGYGMATATYPANRSKATVRMTLAQDGHAVAFCCTQDIGTGTYTVMAQVMADALGLPVDQVEFRLGDSAYPAGPNSGGSQTMATTAPAVRAAALTIRNKVMNIAIADQRSPLYAHPEEAIGVDNGRLFLLADVTRGETYSEILGRAQMKVVETEITTNVSTRGQQRSEANPIAGQGREGGHPQKAKDESRGNPFVQEDEDTDRSRMAFHSFGAQFAKVLVDPLTGVVKVEKIASVMDIGTILNEKTARSQIIGGAVWGIGMALMEGSEYDGHTGRIVTRDLTSYLVPVHADMPVFDIQFTGVKDPYISPVGARGAGEIGITGMAAAIVNAIYNATGKRIRSLPVTPDKLMAE